VNVRLLTLAQQEINEAVIWFNEQVDGMGMDFLDELARVVRLVKSFPWHQLRSKQACESVCSLVFHIR